MSGYDDWKSNCGGWPSVKDPPCPDCGARVEAPCAPDCTGAGARERFAGDSGARLRAALEEIVERRYQAAQDRARRIAAMTPPSPRQRRRARTRARPSPDAA